MDLNVEKKISTYPIEVREVLMRLRETIYSVAKELNIDDLQETLKWGEPSYLTRNGATVRFDWKAKSPQQYCIFFNCKTTLIETFKELYSECFTFEGNRAIVFHLNDKVPLTQLKHCIGLSLRYHKIKNQPLLGA